MTYRAKAFPYPVLSSFSNDFGPEASFAIDLDVAVGGDDHQQVSVDYSVSMSSEWMAQRIASGEADLALDVDGRSTLVRRYIKLNGLEGRIDFAPGELYGTVEFTPLVLAAEDDDAYAPEGVDEEYGDSVFRVQRGDILGVGDSAPVDIEFARMLERDLITIKYSPESEAAGTYRFLFNGPRIIIIAGDDLREAIGYLRASSSTRPYLFMSLYKDCIAAALDVLATDADAGGDSSEYPWGRALLRRLEEIGRSLFPDDPEEQQISAQLLVGARGIRKVDGTGV